MKIVETNILPPYQVYAVHIAIANRPVSTNYWALAMVLGNVQLVAGLN